VRTKIHYEYDSDNDSWVELAPFPGSARIGGCGFSIMGMGYFGFGYKLNTFYNDLYLYYPENQ
jgi:hypothetical protein